MKNNEGAKKKDQYVNTVDEVERITKIDFFPALPDSNVDKGQVPVIFKDIIKVGPTISVSPTFFLTSYI